MSPLPRAVSIATFDTYGDDPLGSSAAELRSHPDLLDGNPPEADAAGRTGRTRPANPLQAWRRSTRRSPASGERDHIGSTCYAVSLGWVSSLIGDTPARVFGEPTPCSEWDVRLLIGHLIGTAYRGRGTAAGVSTAEVPHVVTGVLDDKLAALYAQLADEIIPAFSSLSADTSVRAPWGQVTAAEAVRGFIVETIAHGWDLAVATGRPAIAPPGVAERCLASSGDLVPARLRGVMYAAPVADDPGVSATERLARLLGHH